MTDDLFALLCAALGHDPSSVRVIRLSAGRAGVPAFEAIAGPATSQALAASRADGFAWAMLPDHRIAAV